MPAGVFVVADSVQDGLPGVGHYLPAAIYPQVADEVRALADRAVVPG